MKVFATVCSKAGSICARGFPRSCWSMSQARIPMFQKASREEHLKGLSDMQEFDDILIRIGESGRVQIVLYLLLGIIAIPCGFQNLNMVFLGAKTDHWCNIPELAHLSVETIRNISAPLDKDGAYSKCEKYALDYSMYANMSEQQIQKMPFHNTSTLVEECDSWIYDHSEFKSTVRTQWDLICSKSYITALMQTLYMCGFLLGTITFGIVSDRFGRIKTIMACGLLMIISASLAAIITVYFHFIAFMLVRLIVGMTTAGFYTTSFVLVVELIGPRWRTQAGVFYQGFFAAGFCILPGIAYALRDVLHIQLAAALPTIGLLSFYWVIPESPRWLIQKGRYDEAEEILRKIARLNKKPLPADFSLGEQKLSDDCAFESVKRNGTILDVMKMPRMRTRAVICAYCWFTSGMAYYGISYSAEELGGSIFLNSLISGLVEYPAYFVCFGVVGHPKIGRKYSMAGSFMIAGLSLLICIPLLLKKEYHIPLLISANIGKLGISAAFAIVYIFTAEIFPTQVRAACVGGSSMCARIGALLTPQIMLLSNFWFGSAYIIFGISAVIGGFLSLLLPESVNEVLPETMEDGELFGTKAYRQKHHHHVDKKGAQLDEEMKEGSALLQDRKTTNVNGPSGEDTLAE